MSGSAKAEQRQGGTRGDSSRVEGSVIYHLLPLSSPALYALGFSLCICVCVWGGSVYEQVYKWCWMNMQRTRKWTFVWKKSVIGLSETAYLNMTSIITVWHCCADAMLSLFFFLFFFCFCQDMRVCTSGTSSIYQIHCKCIRYTNQTPALTEKIMWNNHKIIQICQVM